MTVQCDAMSRPARRQPLTGKSRKGATPVPLPSTPSPKPAWRNQRGPDWAKQSPSSRQASAAHRKARTQVPCPGSRAKARTAPTACNRTRRRHWGSSAYRPRPWAWWRSRFCRVRAASARPRSIISALSSSNGPLAKDDTLVEEVAGEHVDEPPATEKRESPTVSELQETHWSPMQNSSGFVSCASKTGTSMRFVN